MRTGTRISAWRPGLPGVREVLHAPFVDHAYPSHTHDAWTLLIVDAGVIRYDLDRHEHGALADTVTLLPPGVPHDGRSVRPDGFRKRVVYLEPDVLDADLVEAAGTLHAHPAHLVRAFTREYGLPPHRYLTGRRLDAARAHLLAGHPVAEAATRAGFYDQSHLARHFTRFLGVTPATHARGAPAR